MDDIQSDVSNEALVTAIRLNMCELFRHLSRSSPADHFENERFVRWFTPLPHPWFNGVVCSDLPAEGDDGFIEETIEYFRGKNVDICTWWLEPHLKPSDWESVLSKYGFGFSNDTPGMAVDLHTISESTRLIDGLEMYVVTDEESSRLWGKVFAKGYGLPPDWEGPWSEAWMKMGLDFPTRNYLGYLNGKPVSTSSVFFGGGVAGIYCVATLPEARGKGIGAALTVGPLLDAREMGYRIGVLQSSEMGFNVYKKLGFKHLCQIENFYLSPH